MFGYVYSYCEEEIMTLQPSLCLDKLASLFPAEPRFGNVNLMYRFILEESRDTSTYLVLG